MKFSLPETPNDIAAALREFEQSGRSKLAPADRWLLVAAATMIEDNRRLMQDAVTELDSAAAMRVGMMDSQSRADGIARQVRATLVGVSARMQEQLSRRPPEPPMAAAASEAVI